MQYQQCLHKNFISLKHPNAIFVKRQSLLKKRPKISKILKFNQSQIQGILKYLRLGQILIFYLALHNEKQAKEVQKLIVNYLTKSKRNFSFYQQRQYMQIIMSRRKKSKNHYRTNRISWFKQLINQDVERTHSQKNISFGETQKMKDYLNNVLCSLSNVYFRIGYIQGFNFIIKSMYQNHYTQLQAFNYMSYLLTEMNAQELYLHQMKRVHQLCYVLQVYIFNYIPKVYRFLKKLQVPTELYAASWFITLFSESLPTRIVNKIWNLFMLKGYKILVKFGIAVIWAFQNQILKSDQIYIFMRRIMEKINWKKQETIWQIMSSLKITNKMIALLAKDMNVVQKDAEIELWKLQNRKMNQSFRIQHNQKSTTANQSTSLLSTSMCYEGPSNTRFSIFHLCTNTQHT